MKIFYSELCVLGGAPGANVDRLIAGGAEHIELMLDGEGWDCFHQRIDTLARELKSKPVTYSVHTPVWDVNLTSENWHMRRAVIETYKETVRFAAALGAGQNIIHPGFCYATCFSKETGRRRVQEAVKELLEFSAPWNVRLLMENVGSQATSLYTMEEFIDFCQRLPKGAGTIVDIGHAHMNGWDLRELLMGVRDNLCALHIHDNDGSGDSHLPIGEGTVDWPGLFQIIKDTGRQLNLTLEYNIGVPVEKLRQGKEILEQEFLRK